MGNIIDLTNNTFGKLTVTNRADNIGKQTAWNCICSCGTNLIVQGSNLRSGASTSCGCSRGEKHGLSKTSEYVIWSAIIDRTERTTHSAYDRYGGNGIKMCKEWRSSFTQFLLDMGKRPSKKHSIDRIDNSIGYSKDNCRWATDKEQSMNKKNNIYITCNGKTLQLNEWAEELGISVDAVRARYYRSGKQTDCNGLKSKSGRKSHTK